MATSAPINIPMEVARFMNGCEIHKWAGEVRAHTHSRHLLLSKLAQNSSMINELPLSPTDQALLRAYQAPPQAVTGAGVQTFNNASLSPQQRHANVRAEQVILSNDTAIQDFGKQMATISARALRGRPEFNAAFLDVYGRGMLNEEQVRGAVIRAGQPDVDFRIQTGLQSAREIGAARQHKNVTDLPLPPPPPPAARRSVNRQKDYGIP